MKLIDAEAVVTANYYDDEHNAFCIKKMTAEEYLNLCIEEGCPKAVEAIPVVWIEEHIKKLQESLVSLTGWPAIEEMVKKWREEQE